MIFIRYTPTGESGSPDPLGLFGLRVGAPVQHCAGRFQSLITHEWDLMNNTDVLLWSRSMYVALNLPLANADCIGENPRRPTWFAATTGNLTLSGLTKM